MITLTALVCVLDGGFRADKCLHLKFVRLGGLCRSCLYILGFAHCGTTLQIEKIIEFIELLCKVIHLPVLGLDCR